uniref:Probable E3 SUMO-protein ligase RNF212 n=1 Tax=Cavia porcellus TaxID=10141 RepID=H0VI54_CAVPO
MANWVFCNRCFQPPDRKSSFSLTSCGHVYCDACLRKGKKDECMICKVPCRTVLLTKHTDTSIQALFTGIDTLCKKYSQDTAQVSAAKGTHHLRLCALCISQLEESLRKSVLQLERVQSMKSSQQTAFSTIKNSIASESNKPGKGKNAKVHAAESHCICTNPEVTVGPARISVISPPQNGRMGEYCSCNLTQVHAGITRAVRSHPGRVPSLQVHYKLPSPVPVSQLPGRAGRQPSPRSTQDEPRPPISIPGLLQRQSA